MESQIGLAAADRNRPREVVITRRSGVVSITLDGTSRQVSHPDNPLPGCIHIVLNDFDASVTIHSCQYEG
jgi:hypothetical protein